MVLERTAPAVLNGDLLLFLISVSCNRLLGVWRLFAKSKRIRPALARIERDHDAAAARRELLQFLPILYRHLLYRFGWKSLDDYGLATAGWNAPEGQKIARRLDCSGQFQAFIERARAQRIGAQRGIRRVHVPALET